MRQDIFLIDVIHDGATVFVCSKRKRYSLGLKTEWYEDVDVFMKELAAIEKMSFKDLSSKYVLDVLPSFIKEMNEFEEMTK